MTGLEKITGQIISEAEENAKNTLREAELEAAKIYEAAQAEAKQLTEAAKEQTDAQLKVIDEQSQSGAALQKRQAILAAKQKLIAQTVADAKSALYALDDTAYFDLLLKMAGKFALPKKGTALLNEKDLARLPKDFEKKLGDAVKSITGAALTIGTQTRAIDGGFILDYDGIEENCSFSALFDAEAEKLQDLAQITLFQS